MTSLGLLARFTRRPDDRWNSHDDLDDGTTVHLVNTTGMSPVVPTTICSSQNKSFASLPKLQSHLQLESTSTTTSTTSCFSPHQTQPHDARYYALCYLAGGLSSSIRWVMSPMELVKTRLQTAPVSGFVTSTTVAAKAAPFWRAAPPSLTRHGATTIITSGIATGGGGGSSSSTSMMSTLSSIYTHEGGIRGLFRGVGPTAAAYWFQTSTKYGLYEVLKDQMATSSQSSSSSRGWTYVIAAATAEAIADILMCPFEMVKARLQAATSLTTTAIAGGGALLSPQSSSSFPSRFGPALAEMIRHRRHYNFPFGSLGPLWGRQIPGTIVNFYTFEYTVQFIYRVLGNNRPKDEYTTLQQLGVTVCAGNVAGVACAVVSHPADSIISMKALPAYAGRSMGQIVQAVGWYRLATRGLLPRILLTGQIISMQWLLYDSFKSVLGLGTSGGDQ